MFLSQKCNSLPFKNTFNLNKNMYLLTVCTHLSCICKAAVPAVQRMGCLFSVHGWWLIDLVRALAYKHTPITETHAWCLHGILKCFKINFRPKRFSLLDLILSSIYSTFIVDTQFLSWKKNLFPFTLLT